MITKQQQHTTQKNKKKETKALATTMLGNGVIGILFETCNKWEKRTPLTPSHYARLLHSGGEDTTTGVARIIVQPSTKRIYHRNWREKKKEIDIFNKERDNEDAINSISI